MSLQVEKLEKNMAKLTIEVSAEDLDKAMQAVYQKMKKNIAVPGFRKGKVPRKMAEQVYGKGVFMEDAVNELIPEAYTKAISECDLEITSQPDISLVQVEPGKALIFTAEVAVKPEVTLGEYMGIEVVKEEITVTDEDIDAELSAEREKNSRTITVEDRAAESGDIVTLDFAGFICGEAFDGGKAENYALTLGSNTFIPGFEDQLIGAETGAHVEVKVVFPENYGTESLAGKPAVFQCDIKKIEAKELPELDDDFAQDVSEFDTLAEYKEDIRQRILKDKETEALRRKEDKVIDKAVENAQMEIPDAMVDTHVNQMYEELSVRMRGQGITMEQYSQFTGTSLEKLREDMKPQALKRLQMRLVLEKIAEVENIQPTEEEIDVEIAKMADAYQLEIQNVKGILGETELGQIKKDICVQKAVTLITEAAKEVEKEA